jgi:hypothetical protein
LRDRAIDLARSPGARGHRASSIAGNIQIAMRHPLEPGTRAASAALAGLASAGVRGAESMASYAARTALGAITALGIATYPACQTASPGEDGESLDATHHLGQLRAAFRITQVPDGDLVPVIGDSIAAGYEQRGAALHMTNPAAAELDLALPVTADGARHLTSGGVTIAARLRAAPASAEIADGYVVYRAALGERTSIIEQVRPDGVEDFFHFPARPASEALAFDVDLEAGVGGLRLVANTLEILDAAGIPRLRVNPPIAVGADGAAVAAKLGIAGCAVDTSPAIPSRVRTPPGARSCQLHLSWSGVTYPALVDPSWVTTGTMAFARPYPASSTVIDDHHVLVTGGYNAATGALNSAEIWDASTGAWTVTGSMTDRRYLHQQVLLGTGKVLATGGYDGVAPYVAASEEYDPSTGTWSHRTVMANARGDFPLVVVAGAPVVLGGFGPAGALAACEKYDPIAHTWAPFATMATPRGGAAAASNGPNAFLVSGGQNGSGWLNSSELYSTAAGTFWAGATMLGKRAYHTANPVTGNPRVLITGGSDGFGYLKTAEVYYGSFTFPQPGSWSAISDMSMPRIRHQAVNLSPGRVMVCGGLQTTTLANTKTCETFDTFPFTWSADCDMTTPRDGFTMLTVPSLGNQLAAGGRTLASAELSCHHDKCTTGSALVSTSSACISSICAVDSFCCTSGWDGFCIQEVRTICGSLTCAESEGSCTHPLCTPGTAQLSGCDSGTANCAASICATDAYCCTTAWDSICVSEVASICGKNCN